MGRIIALDYGSKRTGIAVTDPLKIIANGLLTVETKNIFLFLKEYFEKEAVDCIVVGVAKRMNNMDSNIEKEILPFIEQVKNKFPGIKIDRHDERFTSKMALRTMIDGGLRKKARQNKALVDRISATIILQSYLERKIQ